MPRVFGIGLHKTGTTTLAECLRILGYNLCPEELSYCAIEQALDDNFIPAISLAKHFDAFEDSPWMFPDLFVAMDLLFPDSQFILTVREPVAWFRSILRWVAVHNVLHDRVLSKLLGVPIKIANQAEVMKAFEAHNANARGYFATSGRFLTFDASAGHGWDRLCTFLKRDVPDVPFPHKRRWDEERTGFADQPGPLITEEYGL